MLQKYKTDIIAIIILFFVCLLYLYPVIQGDSIYMSDHMNNLAMIKDCQDYNAKHGTNPFWSSNAFSGMPTVMLNSPFMGNYFWYLMFYFFKVDAPFSSVLLLFCCALGFYFLLRTWKVNQWLALAGGIAFAFTTYNVIILEVGHLT